MSVKESLERVVNYIPATKQPVKSVSIKTKVLWTVGMLALYFAMTNVPIFGLAEGGSSAFGRYRDILAGAQGSVFQLGILPIVTASIVLQVISGADLLPLDLNNPRDQSLYQGLKRLLIFVMVFVSAFPIVFAGDFLPASPRVASDLGVSLFTIESLMFIQIVIGGILIYYMNEVVSKWGIGSGLGLFIIAGVSQRLIGGVFTEILPGWWRIISGEANISFSSTGAELLLIEPGYIVPILTTVAIFAVVVAAESTKVQIPIKQSRTGQRAKYDIKLIYASVLPIILIRAIQANVQFFGQAINDALGSSMPTWLGQYNADGQAIGGLFYYITPIFRPEDWMWFLGTTTAEPWMIAIRLLVDLTVMTLGGALFAVFWVRTTNKDAKAVAKQLEYKNMEIPGFRRSAQKIEATLDRYIPYVTILGGVLIGVLAVLANLLGTIGMVSGTGLLLAVSITVKLYEQFTKELQESQFGSRFTEYL